jgi:general nucleoside transport system permease protein
MSPIVPMIASTVVAATPLIYAALGETVVERSGILNLGMEGMMLIGAVAGFAATRATGSDTAGFTAAATAAVALSLIFGFLTINLQANQVATGLALTMFGIGLSAFVGNGLAGLPVARLEPIVIPGLTAIPVLGDLLFHYDIMVYLSVVLFIGVQWFLTRSRIGLTLRAIGESPHVAHAVGKPVVKTRYLAVIFGGATAGIAGAYLSLVQTPMWVEGMSAGKGWIALALVVFGTWKPARVVAGAYLFGGVTQFQLFAQGFGLPVPTEFLSMLPYLATIIVLVIICRNPKTILLNQPASLGRSFHSAA